MGDHVAVGINRKSGFWASKPGYKPILLLIAALVFVGVIIAPPPQGMIDLVSKINPAGYQLGRGCETIADTMNQKLHPKVFEAKMKQGQTGQSDSKDLMTDEQAAQLAKTMLAIFFLRSFSGPRRPCPWVPRISLWPSCCTSSVFLPINEISKAYMKDAVFFIFGILAVAVGVAKTGLDKRIGLILLSRIKSAKAFAFLFLPLLAMSASFLSEHALVALLIPVLMASTR